MKASAKIALLFIAFASASFAADKPAAYTATEAAKHIGEEAYVHGTVKGVAYIAKDSRLLIDLDGKYPNAPFVVVVNNAERTTADEAKKLEGKAVKVLGKIQTYKDKVEIVVDSLQKLQSND